VLAELLHAKGDGLIESETWRSW